MAHLGPEAGSEVEPQLQGVALLAEPQLLVGGGEGQSRRRLGGDEEGRDARTVEVVDGLQLILDVVDQGNGDRSQCESPPRGGSSPASTSTASRVSLPVRRHDP